MLQREVGGLAVTEWPGTGATVLCLPGLTSASGAWQPLADALPGHRVISVDLRGRGGSVAATGPTGLRAHADDLAMVIRELDLHDVVLVGHSMGAFLAPLVATEVPDRIDRLVLIDGGVDPRFPAIMGPAVIRMVFRRQLRAMVRDWPSAEAFAKKQHLDKIVVGREDLRPRVLGVLRDVLAKTPGGVRPLLDVDRCVADAVDSFTGADVRNAVSRVKQPIDLLLAEHGRYHGAKTFISDKALAAVRRDIPQLTVQRLPGNHVTILFAPEVAVAVAGQEGS
jgi:pimeloyl-ACP methyl ester carboxylesterase